MMPRGVSLKCARTRSVIFSSAIWPVPYVSTSTETGSATPIAYASCTMRALGETGRDDVLGDVARHVAGGAVDLRGILAGERAAAVRRGAAVGVDDDLAAGDAGVAVRAADHEAAGRIDVDLRVLVHHLGGDRPC